MMLSIKGIIFDVDGVLIESEHLHFQAFRGILQSYGFKLTEEGYKKWFAGKSIIGGLASLLHEQHLPINQDQFVKQKISTTLSIFEKNLEFYEDTMSFIDRIKKGEMALKNIGYIEEKPLLALATGLEPEFLDVIRKYHNIGSAFSVMITPVDYTKSKPDPESYLKTLYKMGLSPEKVIGVEDTPSGIKALNDAGVFSIGITTTHPKQELFDAKIITDSLLRLIVA